MGRMMLMLAAPAALIAAPAAAPQARSGVDDPRAFVAETYAVYQRGDDAPVPEPAHAYSARLAALFDAYEAWAQSHDDLVGALDFDWWVNAQDWEIWRVSIIEYGFGPDRRVIEARWTNGERPDSSRFFFMRENGRWYLDDVVNGSGRGGGWTLSALLRERPE